MLAQSAALLFFVSEELADGEPFERLLELAVVRCDDASERGCELRAQRHFAFAFVADIKKLIDNICATLFFVKLCRVERRAFPFEETLPTGYFLPAREDVMARGALLGKQ